MSITKPRPQPHWFLFDLIATPRVLTTVLSSSVGARIVVKVPRDCLSLSLHPALIISLPIQRLTQCLDDPLEQGLCLIFFFTLPPAPVKVPGSYKHLLRGDELTSG